jgi:hypothetical protein
MANVADSLDLALDTLGELHGDLEAALQCTIRALPPDAQAAFDALTQLAVVLGHLGYLRERLGQEKRLLEELGKLTVQRRCPHCGNLFEVTNTKANRAEFCSQACRQAAYRNRRRATEMKAQVTGG